VHERYRYAALDQPHPFEIEPHRPAAAADPRAATVPMNLYLLDRLLEWRSAYSGPLYVFENLMVQGSLSCPQPYTRAMVHELDLYAANGIDGVVYEAFEPGMASFQRQLAHLSRHLWNDGQPADAALNWMPPTRDHLLPATLPEYAKELEEACVAPPGRDPVLRKFLALLARHMEAPSWASWSAIVDLFLQHPGRFDALYIASRLAKRLAAKVPPPTPDPLVQSLLETEKEWDFMERQAHPRQAVMRAIQSLRDACPR
jgi:hypothetical protein